MLLKVETVEEIGRFEVLRHQAPQFGTLTAVFARNGLGKSTLCSIIRSAAEQDDKIIAARRRLGARKNSAVHLHWKGHGAVTYSTGSWNHCPGPIHIFDNEFVRRNLHVGESVTRENKRSLIPIVLGEEGVRLSNRISELDAEQRELVTKIGAVEQIIKRICPVVKNVKTFVETNVPDDIEQIIIRSERSLRLSKNAEVVRNKPAPVTLPLISIDDVTRLLDETIATLSDTAGDILEKHLASHSMDNTGARWLKYGVDHMKGDLCPFCGQDTEAVSIVSVFKGYFSAVYSEFVRKIDQTTESLKQLCGSEGRHLKAFFDKTKTDMLFWNSVCELSQLPDIGPEDSDQVIRSISYIIELLEQKKANPLKSISIASYDEVSSGLGKLEIYQAKILSCISEIEKSRQSVGEFNTARSQEIFDKQSALHKKTILPLSNDVAQWTAYINRRVALESEKKATQEALKVYTKTAIGKKQSAINDLLDNFGARFQICKTETNFIGREANVRFCISIGEHTIEAGERAADKPSFTTVLSAGDKSTLAFAFFLLQVRESNSLANAVIVLDDPFSSQDMDRQWETTSQIRILAEESCQVIVFSHDPRFLALIEKNADRPSFNSCQITCDEDGKGAIKAWKSADELEELYVRQAGRIREFARQARFLPDVTAESLIKDLRPFLESYLRARFPGRFAERIMLDSMANEIEAAGNDDPLYRRVSDLRAINEFTRDNMHGGADAPIPGALRAQCKRVVSIIGAY